MPIQITIEGANALEVKQLVHDLAGTLSGMAPEQIPPQTIVSTINTPAAPAVPVPPQAHAAPAAPAYTTNPAGTSATPPVVPTAPAPAPAAVPTAGQPPVAPPAAPQQPEPTPPPAAVPTAQQTYTIDQLAVAATALVDAGRQPEVMALLQQFGVQALTQLPKEQYGNFATALRQMGAKI